VKFELLRPFVLVAGSATKLLTYFLRLGDMNSLLRLILILAFVYFGHAVVTFLKDLLFSLAGTRLSNRLKCRLLEAIVNKDIAFFDQTMTGELTSRLSNDTNILGESISSFLPGVISSVVGTFFGLVYLFVLSWRLALAMTLLLPLIAVALFIQNRLNKELWERLLKTQSKVNQKATETISQIRTVKVFVQEKLEVELYKEWIKRSQLLSNKLAFIDSFANGCGTLAFNVCIMAGLGYGGILVLNQQLTGGELISFCLFAQSVTIDLAAFPHLISKWSQIVGSSVKIFEILDSNDDKVQNRKPPQPNLIQSALLSTLVPRKLLHVRGDIEFRHVSFAYPTRPNVTVLNDFNLSVKARTSVAIVGMSGSGKSTIISLLERLYEVNQGEILLDGVNIAHFDIEWLRCQLGLVSQEPVLFSTTIANNIKYGLHSLKVNDFGDDFDISNETNKKSFARREKNDEETANNVALIQKQIEEAAKLANAHNFIMKLPQKYDTHVGERGVLLSVGEKQRIAIARAILLNPSILLLDEATSALDNQSEREVQEALERLMKDRTTIIVAHRLSTIQHADVIHVIEAGRVVESGSHEELVAKKGHYFNLLMQRRLTSNSNEAESVPSENSTTFTPNISLRKRK
jgi:ABC-type multidrug transport system fused ATPase/permease subunit